MPSWTSRFEENKGLLELNMVVESCAMTPQERYQSAEKCVDLMLLREGAPPAQGSSNQAQTHGSRRGWPLARCSSHGGLFLQHQTGPYGRS